MKIRTGFVSNSSSSGFIIKDNEVFDYFKITKEDIDAAILDLVNKDEVEKQYNSSLKSMKEYCTKKEEKEFIENYLTLMDKIGYESFDTTRPEDSKKVHKKYDDFLNDWDATSCGNVRKWRQFNDFIDSLHLHFVPAELAEDKKDAIVFFNVETLKDEKTPDYVMKFWKYMKRNLGIRTRKEVLSDKDSRFFIHFDDNCIYYVNGMTDLGVDEVIDDKESDDKKLSSCKFKSESYSGQRFFEVLVSKLVDMKKIDLSDEKFLKLWNSSKNNQEHEENHLNRSDSVSLYDIALEIENRSEYCMHEG